MPDSESPKNSKQTGGDESLRAANDHFVQGFFGIEDAARGFLQPTIIPELSDHLDWSEGSMELIRGLFVDSKLRYRSSDLLWKIKTTQNEDAFVCVSFDHQTRPDKWMALRYLRIVSLAQEKLLSEDDGKPRSALPIVYCIVLYQGSEPWSASLEYQDLVNFSPFPLEKRDAIKKFIPTFQYQVVQLQTTPDEELPSHPLTQLGLKLMRAAIVNSLAEWVKENRTSFSLLLHREDKEIIFNLMFNYAAQKVRNEDELEELNQAIETLDDPARKEAMNGAQILEARGEARGKAKGKIEDARRMLDRDFEVDQVADILAVPAELVQPLANGQEPDFQKWLDFISDENKSEG